MIHLECVQTYQYIKCFDQESGNLIFCHNYRLYPDRADLADITIDPEMKIQWQKPYLPNSDLEISIKYRPFSRRHESFKEVTISQERILDNALCIGKVLDEILGLTYIANIFKDKGSVEFPFTIFIRESVNLGRLRAEELIKIDIDGDNQQKNVVISNNLADIKILDYPYTLGDLEKRIIWNIKMFTGRRSENWQIEVGKIRQPFTPEEFRDVIEAALQIQTEPVLKRIPTYLRRKYPESIGDPLNVVVTIDEVQPEIQYSICFTLRDPAKELYYRTNKPALDRVILDVHQRLMELGVGIGQEADVHQRILSQILLYRDGCLSIPGYIEAGITKKTEVKGFHEHLHERLQHDLSFGPPRIISEADIGNSRIDLLIEDIPIELKLENRKTFTTTQIVDSYKRQAADYVARCNAPFGFLVVLDTVLDRKQPTSPVAQDVKVEQVTTVSGEPVIVIAIIIRIPRSASDFTTLANRDTNT